MDESGEAVALSRREYDILKPQVSYAEQDIVLLWQKTTEALREITANHRTEAARIAGIGFSGQMHGLVMLGKDCKPLHSAIIWADQRSQSSIDEISRLVPDYRDLTLNSLSTGFLASSLVWIKDNEPETYGKIYRVMLPKDYIRYRICGEFGTDYSDASGSGMFETAKKR